MAYWDKPTNGSMRRSANDSRLCSDKNFWFTYLDFVRALKTLRIGISPALAPSERRHRHPFLFLRAHFARQLIIWIEHASLSLMDFTVCWYCAHHRRYLIIGHFMFLEEQSAGLNGLLLRAKPSHHNPGPCLLMFGGCRHCPSPAYLQCLRYS